jgi:hypothetical protein
MNKKKKINFKQWLACGGKMKYNRGGESGTGVIANTNATSGYVEPERYVYDENANTQRTIGSVISGVGGVAAAANPIVGAILGAVGGIVSSTAQPQIVEKQRQNTNPYGYKLGGLMQNLDDPIRDPVTGKIIGYTSRAKRSEVTPTVDNSTTKYYEEIYEEKNEHQRMYELGLTGNRSNSTDVKETISKEERARRDAEVAAEISKINKKEYVNGGDLEAISNDSIQVDADNPSLTDSVETDKAFLDHNEVVTGSRVYSDSLINPNTGNSFAKDESRLQKILGKIQKNKERSGDTEYKDEEYLNRNSKALFETQEQVAQMMGLRNEDGTPKQEGGMKFGGKMDPPKGNPIEEMILNKIMLLKNQDKPMVKRLLSSDPQVINNDTGESMKASEARGAKSISTHVMTDSYNDGSYTQVFPTVSEDSKGKLSHNEDVFKALDSGDYMNVPANMAEKFAKTGYKQGAKGLNEDVGYKFKFGGMIGKKKPKYIGGGPIKDPTNLFGQEVELGSGENLFGNTTYPDFVSPGLRTQLNTDNLTTLPSGQLTLPESEYDTFTGVKKSLLGLNNYNPGTTSSSVIEPNVSENASTNNTVGAGKTLMDRLGGATASETTGAKKFNEFPFGEVGTGVGLVSNIINKLTNKPTNVDYADIGKPELDMQEKALQGLRRGESTALADATMEGKVAKENLDARSLQTRNANLRNIATGIAKAKAGIRDNFANRMAGALGQFGARRSALEEANRQKNMNVDVINTQEADAVRTEAMKMDENVRKLLIEYQLSQNNRKTNDQLSKLLRTQNFKFDPNSEEGIQFIKVLSRLQNTKTE